MATVVNKTTFEVRRSVNTPLYDMSEWLINYDLSALAGVLKRYWKLDGNNIVEMTTGEKAAVDTDISGLTVYKRQRRREEQSRAEGYIENHYSPFMQRMLLYLLTNAQGTGKPNRAALINTAWQWMGSVLISTKDQVVTINSKTNVPDIEELEYLVYSGFDVSDPNITIPDVLAITD